ncbi:MAG: integration host factor subunit beta [Bacteroidetes bacterium]|nr:integration host factor subunit beta [Bacteroidota bacterium]
MTKAEVVAKIAEKTGAEKSMVLETVDTFFDVVKDSMHKGENIFFRGFGSFTLKKRAKKIARNITKNTAMLVDAHYIPKFKPAKSFADKIKKIKVK